MDLLMVVLVSGLIASLLKIAGGVLYGSNTLFVDATTSFANIISLFTTLAFNRVTVIPPDSDHHFGHERYEYAGILSTLIVYSFVAGVALSRLYFVKEYIVLPEATLYAILAMAIYSIAIVISMRLSQSLRTYGLFTMSELIEGTVSIFASLGGAYLHYLIDYGGGVLLTTYVIYEIIKVSRDFVNVLVDIAPSSTEFQKVLEAFRESGVSVERLRLRVISRGKIHGDALIRLEGASEDKLERVRKMLELMGVDICIETQRSNE